MESSDVKKKARALVEALNLEWKKRPEYNLNALKKLPGAQAILHSPADVQVAVAKEIIENICLVTDRVKNDPSDSSAEKGFPWGAAYFQSSLLKRPLPFSGDDLSWMFERLGGTGYLSAGQFEFLPVLAGILERFTAENSLSPRLKKAAAGFLEAQSAQSFGSDAADRKLADKIKCTLNNSFMNPRPTKGGAPLTESSVKTDGERQSLEREGERILDELKEKTEKYVQKFEEIAELAATKEILNGTAALQIAFIRKVCEALGAIRKRLEHQHQLMNLWHEDDYCAAAVHVMRKLMRKKLPFTQEDFAHLMEQTAQLECVTLHSVPYVEQVIGLVETHLESNSMNDPLRQAIMSLSKSLNCIANRPEQRCRERLEILLSHAASGNGGAPVRLVLQKGEAWSDCALSALEGMSDQKRLIWSHLLAHCQSATGSSPSKAWIATARQLVKQVRPQEFASKVPEWFNRVNEPRTQRIEEWIREYQPDPNQLIIEPHADLLKGLAWCSGLHEDKTVSRALTALALSAYRKVPKIGPRAVKIGNACVTALGMMTGMEGVYQLAFLKVKVKFGTAQKAIEKALNASAERVGLSRDELEEMAVPECGMKSVGVAEEKMGEFTALLTVTGTNDTELTWIKEDGKAQRGVPALVKKDFGEDLKELQATAKDIQRILPAQRERLDSMFLQQRTWKFPIWRERYLDHPLVGFLARRLLWEFTNGKEKHTGIWFNGELVDLDLKAIKNLDEQWSVGLWHPIDKSTEEIVAWRTWFDAQQIQQPFKQAHREIYVLTDAEIRTGTYSNRFAAHVLKQHQFNALCALRGWKNKLRLMVDDEYPPTTLFLPKWNLRAEFWVEGIGQDYGTDTNESGVYLRLSTDQVRFYQIDAVQRTAHAGGGGYHPGYRENDGEPLPLGQIPPLVFSEVMRDVDMFVGVASVGNDPAWADGGRDGRYSEYWQNYSFGALNASAKTRLEVLQRLVPRLKIAKQCSFDEKFLVVKGTIRTYKIHLGSGNILMEPNDQYLCIVPKQGGSEDGKVLLPFEGDRTLSVIISKAFLLAEDQKIKDTSILSQIKW